MAISKKKKIIVRKKLDKFQLTKSVILLKNNIFGCCKHVEQCSHRDFWFQNEVVVFRHVKTIVGFWSSNLGEDGLSKFNWTACVIGICHEIILWHFVDISVAEYLANFGAAIPIGEGFVPRGELLDSGVLRVVQD